MTHHGYGYLYSLLLPVWHGHAGDAAQRVSAKETTGPTLRLCRVTRYGVHTQVNERAIGYCSVGIIALCSCLVVTRRCFESRGEQLLFTARWMLRIHDRELGHEVLNQRAGSMHALD